MAAASPPPMVARHSSSSFSSSPSSFFQLPTKKRRQNRLMEQRRSEQAAVLLQEEASLRAQALIYLDDFLHNSQWNDQLDQITIVREAVPTMPELNSYGDLDEKEGTRACRRMFKAVVIWDELGHTLWRTLQAASEQRQLVQRQFELLSAATGFPDELFTPAAFTTRRRPSRRSSEDSYDSAATSSRLSHESTTRQPQPLPQPLSQSPPADKKLRTKLSKKLSTSSASSTSSSSWRTSSESESPALDQQPPPPYHGDGHHHLHHQQQQQQQPPHHQQPSDSRADASPAPATSSSRRAPHDGEPSLSAFPRILSHNCASAVRRRFGVFGESRSSLMTMSAGRQPHGHSHHPSHSR
ncbi:hypothetical protein CDD83_9802 [Cordyceps sp. RAO-2017]|nr:hypothetical protein CDD83_9802 [Cordyceps sp. RAO-2017]